MGNSHTAEISQQKMKIRSHTAEKFDWLKLEIEFAEIEFFKLTTFLLHGTEFSSFSVV